MLMFSCLRFYWEWLNKNNVSAIPDTDTINGFCISLRAQLFDLTVHAETLLLSLLFTPSWLFLTCFISGVCVCEEAFLCCMILSDFSPTDFVNLFSAYLCVSQSVLNLSDGQISHVSVWRVIITFHWGDNWQGDLGEKHKRLNIKLQMFVHHLFLGSFLHTFLPSSLRSFCRVHFPWHS